jgi:transmembrane sensor
MTKEEFKALLDRYVKGSCSAIEQQYFDDFYKAFQKDDSYWKDWELTERDRIKIELYQSLTKAMESDDLAREIPVEEFETSPKRSFIRAWLNVAASVIILVAAGWILYTSSSRKEEEVKYITHTTSRGQQAVITLQDGSVVKLNNSSAISFPEKFANGKREVTLQGEAFFEVKRDPEKPFVVKTGDLTTAVLGTSFNICAYQHKPIEVTVKTGRVLVANVRKQTDRLELHPNQQIYFDPVKAIWEKREVSLERYLAWTDKIIYLDNTRMEELTDILEKWYDVTITLDNKALGNCTVSGKYKSDRLTNILEGLKIMHGIEYRFASEHEIVIKGKPCKP